MRGERAQVFLSYDLEHDRDLHDRLLAESKGSSVFSIASRSELRRSEAESDEHLRAQIAAADAVIVICGEHTDACAGVAAELRISREQNKPHLLLWGRRESMCKKPSNARPDDSMYGWNAETLRTQLHAALRAERARAVPEHLRRQAPPKPTE